MLVNDLRVFIPSKNYEESQAFYQALGFEMEYVSEALSLFQNGTCTFFLQRFFNKELAKNLMIQLIVDDITSAYKIISEIKGFHIRYDPIITEPWGKIVYLWGPSGELWHITELNKLG